MQSFVWRTFQWALRHMKQVPFMNILTTNYTANFSATMQSLETYYLENTDAPSDDTTIAVSPYASSDDKISLEADVDGNVVGRLVGAYDPITNSVRIEALFVDSSCRGKNIGASLVAHFENEARQNRVQMSFVDTTSSSAPKFYEKLGYKLIGEVDDYPMSGETYYFYMKKLA